MKNVGSVDKVTRYILGVVLIALGIVLQVTVGAYWWVALIGLVPIVTAMFSVCPLYLLLGISSAKK